MKERKPIYSLAKSQIEVLSERHIRGVDKWYRMYAGLASNLERYEEGIMYLKIKNTEEKFPSDHETAVKFARSWLNGNKELRHAKGFVVFFYKTKFTGFMISGEIALANKEGVAEYLARRFKEAEEEGDVFVDIFSGKFNS